MTQLLLFIHVMAAIVWVGGFIMHLALMGVARRAGGPEERVKLFRYDDRLSTGLYIPASLTTLAAGVALVLVSGISFGAPWVSAGLAVWIIAFLTGILFYMPTGKKLEAAIEAHGAGSREVEAIMDRVRRVNAVDIALLLFAVFAMTTKLSF